MSGVSTTSTTTLKTDVTSKVLPGDKSGLPLEIWQIIFSYLSVRDLGCVTRVSKTWHDLALSIDMTRWKELYLACKEWRHPYWPLNVRLEPPSWKQAYRDQYLSTRFWRRCSGQAHKAGCMSLLKRSKERQNIQVGPGLQHETLKSAFAVANEYDRILVHPGIYDEQLEMTLKVPFELVGVGELGSVILVVCLEHLALTGRLSNLVLRAPWFSNFILKVRSGYVQVDNCIMEDGMMCVVNPASCHVQFCTLRHATVILQHVNASVIRNCEFSQSDNANIVVEGYPKEDKSWAFTYLCQQTDEVFSQKQAQGYKNLLKVTDSTTSTLHSTFTGKSFTASTIKTYDTLSRGRAFSQECDYMNVGVVNSGVNGHAGGAAQSGVNVNSGAHLCGMKAEARDVNGSRANGMTLNINRPVGSEQNTQEDIRSTVSHSTDANVHKQNPCEECSSASKTPLGLTTDEGQGDLVHAETCCHGNNEEGGNDTDDGEWLEINDERKPWQLEGEERQDRATKPRDLKSLEEPEEDCASPEHKPSSSATGKAATSDTTQGASEKLFEKRDTSQQGAAHNMLGGEGGGLNHKPTSYAKGDGKTGHSPKRSDLGGIAGTTAEAKKETGHSKNLGWDPALDGAPSAGAGAGASRGESEMTQAGEIVPQTHTVDVHPKSGKDHLVNGDAFPQHLAALNKGDHSGDHDPNPPILLNPHPHPLRPNSDPHPHQHHHHHHHHHHPHPPQPLSHSANSPKVGDNVDHHPLPRNPLEAERGERRSQGSFHSSRKDGSSSEDDDDLSILNDLESVGSRGSHHAPSSSSSEDEVEAEEELFRRHSVYDCSDAEESVIMLPHLRQKHLEASLSANAVNADVGSICSQVSRPITFSATQDEGVLSYIRKVRGCLIHHCRMMHSKGGVMVSLQGHALISGCDISNVSYGVRCIQNSRVVMLKNRIHHCRTSGIFMRLAASGLISGNDIHSNNEAGLDIRKNADPIVQHNRIHHGKRSGVVVLGSGRGHIRSNSIYSNTEAGIYILYGGNPTVSENTIYDGKAAGVAVNEGGQGYIFDNTISSNQWGGVDIRRGSCPMVCRNTITNGLGDGIVIGDQGQGTIENNVISDNAGCGLWLMSASRPYIHGNQISNNGDTGVMMVNKTDIQHEGSHLLPAGAESVDHISRSLSMMGVLDDVPAPLPKCQHTTLQHNNIYHNAGRGVAVELGGPVDILYNAIYANHHDGVLVHQEAPLVLCSNSISSNRGNGVVTALTTSMEISGNGIYDNRDCGIVCSSHVEVCENDVVGNQAGGITVDENAVVKISANRIQATTGHAVKVTALATEVVVEGNQIYSDCGQDIVDLSQRAKVRENHTQLPALAQDKVGNNSRHKYHKDAVFNKSLFLKDPPPRPSIQPPPPPSDLPAHNVSSITKVMLPSGDTCQEGSKLCRIL